MAPPRQVLRQQLEILMDYMEENKELTKGTATGSLSAQQYVRQKWMELAKKLNAVESGALKTPEKWKRYWIEWRYKCRTKAADARRFRSGPNRFVPMNDLEIRVVELSEKDSEPTNSTSKASNQLESSLAEDEDSDSQPLKNIQVQAIPVRKVRPKTKRSSTSRSATSTSRSALDNHQNNSDYRPQSTSPPPQWALNIEERRIAAEERMATALETIASVMQSQEERRTILDERIAEAVTSIAGTVQEINNDVQEALQHLHRMNPATTNELNFKGNYGL